MAVPGGNAPPPLAWQASVVASRPWDQMVPSEKFEFPTYRLQGDCTTVVLTRQIGGAIQDWTVIFSSQKKNNNHYTIAPFILKLLLQKIQQEQFYIH